MTKRFRPRRIWAVTAVFAVVVPVVAAMSGSSAQAAAGSPVIGEASGRCLDVRSGSTTPGTTVQIWDCTGAVSQSWQLTAAGELRVFDGTRCMEARNNATTPPVVVQIN